MNKMKMGSLLASFLMMVTITSACGTANNDAGQDGGMQNMNWQRNGINRDDSRQFGMNAARNGRDGMGDYRDDLPMRNNVMNQRANYMRGDHNNSNMENSQDIAEQLAAMDGVKRAYVLLTDRNAYVAVQVDGESDYGRKGQLNPGSAVNRMNNREGNRGGGQFGSDLQFGEYNRMNEQGDLTQVMKNRIADKVKSLKPDIHNVYVSANPDFADRLSGYASKLEQGEPIEGLLEEFNTLAERLFPQEAGENSGRIQRDMMDRTDKQGMYRMRR